MEEMEIHKRLCALYMFRNKTTKRRDKFKKGFKNQYFKNRIKNILKLTNKEIKHTKKKLYGQFKEHKGIRNLNENTLIKSRIISIFDSVLTRTLGLEKDGLYKDIIIVQTYFFDVLKDIILDGFMLNGEKYVFFTASAGQIRTKKTVFIKESLLKKYKLSLMCGLSVDDINKKGGVNINKYIAYLALCNSATDEWVDFNIDKAIVVDDFETTINGLVDFIDDEDYTIKRKLMDISIEHTDGCGMILPKLSKKNMTIRLPWMKGLLVSFPYDKFIKEKNGNAKIKDVYGKEWDVIEDEIEIIFVKSQFKMWKFYNSWDHYKNCFKKYNCQGAICNVEVDEFKNAKINYQMLQTLTDMNDKELETISKTSNYNITHIGRDRKTMLMVLGVTKANFNKNYMQQALDIYPELLNDKYNKEILKSVKRRLVKEARAGKLDINGSYTFISPDLYAFCEYLFLGDKNPKGLLANGEVFCNIFKNNDKLDCLRAPHLYREHPVRKNVVDSDKKQWFTTNGLYTSCHDLISRVLQFDVDGDMSLVVAEETIVNVAERNMKNIVPLFYNMRKAGEEQITNNSMYNGMITAYTGGNIGMISNDITKIWNSKNPNLDVVKLLCAENNFVIDYAKTLYKPVRPKNINNLIHNHTKSKLPHFFIYAKDKNKKQVEKPNNSVVNRLNKIIKNTKLSFTAINLGNFDYKMLMNNPNVELNISIIDKYTKLDLGKRFIEVISDEDKGSSYDGLYIYKDIRDQLLNIFPDKYFIADVLIKYLYNYKKSSFKTTLWSCFGDVIVDNLKNNIDKNYLLCEVCGKRIEKTSNNKKYCDSCVRGKQLEWQRKSMKKIRNM